MTPKAWQLAFRAQRLRNALNESATITDAVLAAGFPDNSSYYRQADAALGMTARQYRRGGDDTNVCYALSRCALGHCLVAQSERGICAILLADNDDALLEELRSIFPGARREQADESLLNRLRRSCGALIIRLHLLRCLWTCAVRHFSSRSGMRCAPSRQVKPSVISRWRTPLVSRARCVPSPAPVRRTSWRLWCPVIGWFGLMAGCPVIVGGDA
jgi:hypothetical protein